MEISRREMMKWGAGSGLGAFAASILERRGGAGGTSPAVSPTAARGEKAQARACILLYMAGGPSHIDTFDPKPGRPVAGSFRAIGSSVDGVQLCEHLPRLAARMKDIALIRSLTSKEGNHDRARHLMHTSYPPQGGVDHPAFGAIVSETRARPGLPGYVAIAGPGEDSGFLSAVHSPFPVRNPTKPVRYLTPAKGVDQERFERRLGLWRGLEAR